MQRFAKNGVILINTTMNPLKLLAILLFLTANGIITAQTNADGRQKKYELGMSLYSLVIRGGDYYSGYKNRVDNYVLSGIYFRKYYGRRVMRLSLDYQQKIGNNRPGWLGYDNGFISQRLLQCKAGYQYFFNSRSTGFYVSADLAYSYSSEQWAYPLDYPLNYLSSYAPRAGGTADIRTSAFSCLPAVGLRIHLGKNVMLNLESAAQFFYAIENKSNKMIGINARPLNCSLGFRF